MKPWGRGGGGGGRHGNNSQINDVTGGRHLGFSNFQILFKFSLLCLRLTGKTAFSGWNPRNRSNPLWSFKYLVSFQQKIEILQSTHRLRDFLRWRHHLWRHLISVKRCVSQTRNSCAKAFDNRSKSKNSKPKKIEGGGSIWPPPPSSLLRLNIFLH